LLVPCAYAVPARVDYVIDGDTFSGVVKLDGGIDVSVRVRLRNVDTPEINGQCEYERNMAARAKARLAEIIPAGTTVELTNIKDDKYLGRIDANVADSRGNDVGATLIREKLGRKYNGGRRAPWCK
jgi:endonuclease YncB( thermonuclease family)